MRKSLFILVVLITVSYGQIFIHDLDITEFCLDREIDEMGLNSEYSNPASIISKSNQVNTTIHFAGSNPTSQFSYFRNFDKYGVLKLGYAQMFGSAISVDYYDSPSMRFVNGEMVPDGEGTLYNENLSGTNMSFQIGYAKTFWNSLDFGVDGKYYLFNRSEGKSKSISTSVGIIWRTKLLSKNRFEGLNFNFALKNAGSDIELFKYYQSMTNGGENIWLQMTPPLLINFGLSVVPFQWNNQYIKASIDAVHPNYMAESIDLNLKYFNSTKKDFNYYMAMGYRQSIGDHTDYDPFSDKYYDRSKYYGFSFGAGIEYQLKNAGKIYGGFAFTENENELFKRNSINFGYIF